MKNDPVFRTDQLRCFDEKGDPVTCDGTGQDGDLKPGASWPEPRFVQRRTVVSDRLTGLFWMQDAGKEALPMSWEEAFAFIEDLNDRGEAGRTDWRLPARRELFSLVSHSRTNPVLPEGHPFSGVFPGYYWSATSCAASASQAWYVHLGGGRVYKGMKHGSYMVWPVAGPPYRPYRGEVKQKRFAAEADTVRDLATGRIWTRTPVREKGPMTWTEALATVAKMNRQSRGGATDWRLPGVRELESLIDETAHSPALPGAHPFDAIPQGCWTSTTSVYEPSYAWVVYFREGAVGVGFKANADFGLWPVRGGSMG